MVRMAAMEKIKIPRRRYNLLIRGSLKIPPVSLNGNLVKIFLFGFGTNV